MGGMTTPLEVHPLTADRWPDLVTLFGDRGDPAWCWCSFLRVPMDQHTRELTRASRANLERLAGSEQPPGLIGYRAGVPVGWVSVAPRQTFAGFAEPAASSDEAVWSVTCFVVRPDARRTGVGDALLQGAIAHARASGARVLEGYPVEPHGTRGGGTLWTGVRSIFDRAGFSERGRFDRWAAVPAATGPTPRRVGKPPGRPVMRLDLA